MSVYSACKTSNWSSLPGDRQLPDTCLETSLSRAMYGHCSASKRAWRALQHNVKLRVQVPKHDGTRSQEPFEVWYMGPNTPTIWATGPSRQGPSCHLRAVRRPSRPCQAWLSPEPLESETTLPSLLLGGIHLPGDSPVFIWLWPVFLLVILMHDPNRNYVGVSRYHTQHARTPSTKFLHLTSAHGAPEPQVRYLRRRACGPKYHANFRFLHSCSVSSPGTMIV